MKEPVDHVLRPQLPWRNGEDAITECGYDASKVKTLTREEFFARLKSFGRIRTAMVTCMTCVDTAGRWQTWDDDPRRAMEREITWECRFGYRDDPERGTRLRDELLAIAGLIEAHREDFDALVRVLAQRRAWIAQKETLKGRRDD